MDAFKVLQRMSQRCSVGKPPAVATSINLYTIGVCAKLREAHYALEQLSILTGNTAPVGIDGADLTERIHFYTDAFFAFLYSSLDVLAQVINQTMPLSLTERDVSFKAIDSNLRTNHDLTAIQKEVTLIVNGTTFKDLDKYRNCSTHRR